MAIFDTPKEAFGALRPICIQITKEQTVNNIQCLQSQLQKVGDAALQELQEYVLFPLRFSLKTPGLKQERFVQSVVECIHFIISRTCVRNQQQLCDLFSELSLCLSSPSNHGKLAIISEELKMAVVQGLIALLHSAYGDIVLSLYQPDMLPSQGFVISLLLDIAEHEKSRQLQVLALKCLLVLILQCDCPDTHCSFDNNGLLQVGNSFASFLPGITLGMTRIISGDVKQGHLVTTNAIKVWYKVVGLVMANDQVSKNHHDNKMLFAEESKLAELVICRKPEWVNNTASKLDILLQKLCSCAAGNSHWKVRLELVELVYDLLSYCNKSLKQSIGHLLEVLVGLVGDERPEVQTRCSQVLKNISELCVMCENKDFTDVLSENLHTLTTALPRLMRTLDDQSKLKSLGLLLGYLKLLGRKVSVVLNSTVHLGRLSKALMQILELDVTDVRIVEERHLNSETKDLQHLTHPSSGWDHLKTWMKPAAQRKYFKYFMEECIFVLLQQICRVLGYYGNLYLLVDHFMDFYQQSVVYRKQAAIVINELLLGAAGLDVDVLHERETLVSTDDLKATVTSIIEEYTSMANWHLVTSIESEYETGLNINQPKFLDFTRGSHSSYLYSSQSLTVHTMNSNIWQICIQLEGIGYFAHVLNKEFRLLLMVSLYPVIEKVGAETLLVSQMATRTLVDLCQACGYDSLQELINQNSDYLVNTISLNLRSLTQHPHTPRVISVMFSYSDASLLPLVDDVVQDILLSLDHYYNEKAQQIFTVLHSLMSALAHWFPPKDPVQKKEKPQDKACRSGVTADEIQCFFKEYQKQKHLAEGDIKDIDLDKTDDIPDQMEPYISSDHPNVKKELPAHIQIAKDVMERCIHLLSDKSVKLRLKVLDVLELCVVVLQCNVNELLPMVHRLWSPLVQRLTSDDPLVILRAFKVLCKLADGSGDFLRSRVSKDILPKVTRSLVSQAPVSTKAGPIYSHTLSYKLQLAELQGLGKLCEKLDLGETDLDMVASTCLPYLSSRQPLKLQDAACSVFYHLNEVDPDATWLILNEVYCPNVYNPPHSSLPAIQLTGMGKQRNEFTDNVLRLLQEFE
ncbi:TELO2-interacting protein 1 homolog isoform X2 [Carcharodon carcharias]|uniref:TELO2-interacting protein 1 homolog isoform X2 n=1 Tax=Carcharodon carcharias TaxID=13397 RepID=UPI001B7E4A8F|nr:TELO2-interacting protein 1 homolog isoform X2 [Carcharodon carcharias]